MFHEIKNLLWPYARNYKLKLFGAFIFSLMLAGIKGIQAYLVKPIFDEGLSAQSTFNDALMLVGLLLFLGIVNFPVRFFHFYWMRFIVDSVVCQLRSAVYAKIMKLPMSYFQKQKMGTALSYLLNDTQALAQGLRGGIDLVREPLTAFVMLGLALYRDWQLTVVVLFVTPLFVIVFRTSGKKVNRYQHEVQGDLAEITHVVSEGIDGQKNIKAYNLQNYMLRRFLKNQQKYFQSLMKTSMIEEIAHPLVEFIGVIAFSGVILFAHHRIQTGEMSTGDFVSFVTALALLMDPIRKYSQAHVKVQQCLAAGQRLSQLMQLPEEPLRLGEVKRQFTQSLELKNICFSYNSQEGRILEDINLSIYPGQKIAFVGMSGSGKSTLLSLLLGLYPLEENQGEIIFDGVSLNKTNLHEWRNLFSLVTQENFLFHDSIIENIALGGTYTQQELNNALETAYAQEFVQVLPQKDATIVGDRGARLSGGQQQRLNLARAFLFHAPILLLDEATSALDNQSERMVQKALEEVSKNKTVIAVAHRLSTIQNFDIIHVFKEGRIIESGKHEELLKVQGEYYNLYKLHQHS